MIKKLSLAVGLGFGMCAGANAMVSVNPMLVFFNSGDAVQDVTITNDANTTAYVQITPSLVQNPGMSSEKQTTYQLGMDTKSFGLMVSPLKVVIPANGFKKVRLVALQSNPSQDVVYYLQFSEVPSLVPAASSTANGTTNIQMTNQISYKVQALILPAKPMPQVNITRQGTTVTAKNTGNSYASLRNGQICNTAGSDCKPLPDNLSYKVLYAGNTWTFTAPAAGVVKFDVIYNKDQKSSAKSN